MMVELGIFLTKYVTVPIVIIGAFLYWVSKRNDKK